MSAFEIVNIAFGVGNRDYQKREPMAEAYLVLDGARVRLFLHNSGDVSFPASISDPGQRGAIAAQLRSQALRILLAAWRERTRRDRDQ